MKKILLILSIFFLGFSYCFGQVTIAVEDFDGGAPAWPNDVAAQAFVDPSSPNEGLFIEPGSGNIPTESGDIAHARDLGGESGEPTLSPFTFTFDPVDVSGFNTVVASFDFAVSANADAGEYEWIIDGVGQGQVTFYDDPDSGFETGTITINVGTASTVALVLTGTLNGSSDVLDLDNFIITGIPLPAPVELTFFKTELNKGLINLDWQTASETNNDYFSVEYSSDARNYTEIGQINGAGTIQTKQNYSYTHRTPANGLNYYRLKQIDFDGAFEYSPVQVVEVKRETPIRIFPSQAFETITVDLAEAAKEETVIGVYDVMGRMVLSQVMGAEATRSELNVANLTKGHYFIQLQSGSERYTERFIKIN